MISRERIDFALQVVDAGNSFRLDGIRMFKKAPSQIAFTGTSTARSLEEISKEMAKRELDEMTSYVVSLRELSPKLDEFLRNKDLIFNLGFQYGQGAVPIARATKKGFEWLRDK